MKPGVPGEQSPIRPIVSALAVGAIQSGAALNTLPFLVVDALNAASVGLPAWKPAPAANPTETSSAARALRRIRRRIGTPLDRPPDPD